MAQDERGSGAARGFILLYAALYGGYGALSPFLPAFLAARGLGASEIAALLSAAMLVRLAAGPLAGNLADRWNAAARLLSIALILAAILTLTFLAGHAFPLLLGVTLVQAAATGPLAPLADAVVLAGIGGGAAYGRIRAAGSAAFIVTTVLTGYLIGLSGDGAGLVACAALFTLAAASIPRRTAAISVGVPDAGGSILAVSRDARFRRLVLAAAMVIGAHAMHDAFAVIVWQAAGIGPRAAGLLWAEAVAAEVLVFLWLGPRIIARIGPGRALALAALAGALRWSIQARTAWLPILGLIQTLHGLTFALLHLSCLRLIADTVPASRRATALSLYGTFGLGLASAAMTLVSGQLYRRFGIEGFWAMAAVSLAAIPVAWKLRGGR